MSAPVASSSRSRCRTGGGGGGVNGGQVADAVAADPPEGLEREAFPVVVAPALDRRLAEPVEQLGEAVRDPRPAPRLRDAVPARLAAARGGRASPSAASRRSAGRGPPTRPPARTRRSAFASATYQTSSSVGPVRSGYWSIASRRSSRVPKQGIVSPRPVAQVLLQHLLELGEPDPAPPQRLAVAVLGQVGLAAEDLGPLLDRLVERQVLEGVERVVVDEDGDRPLRRQQVRGVLDDLAQMLKARLISAGFARRSLSGC